MHVNLTMKCNCALHRNGRKLTCIVMHHKTKFQIMGQGNESALAFYCFSFLSLKQFKISSCGNYYSSLLILGTTFIENTSKPILQPTLTTTPTLHPQTFLSSCFSLHWRSTPFCHNFSKSPIVTQQHHDGLGAKEGEEEVGIGHECNVVGSGLF
jgi:hypothetical protein